jgi:hypothetical protein
MASERLWGQPPWLWTALAMSTVPAITLLLFSLTVSGRTFAVMLLVAEAFTALSLFMGWAQTERMRIEDELGGTGELPPGS